MKRIIDRKRYDTETAEKICEWRNGYGCTDFHFCEETLYRTRAGNWFLHGEGGALSGYSQPCGGNGSCGGERIVPISADAALEWCEEHGQTEAIERHFAESVQDA